MRAQEEKRKLLAINYKIEEQYPILSLIKSLLLYPPLTLPPLSHALFQIEH